jgi:cellulose synthase (UDP-forming)
VPLVLAETYRLVDAFPFGLTAWRIRQRDEPPTPGDATVELVMATARAALAMRHPHRTWVLDDGAREEMRDAAAEAGIGYLTRSFDWIDRPRHAKAGNLNIALLLAEGEFLLILDADQAPSPHILDRTLGWFHDPRVALVQTPQYFVNVDDADMLGSQAPLFCGPIQQGKDGVQVHPDRLEARFRDPGSRLEVNLDAAATPGEFAESGRGLALARTVAHELTYRHDGFLNHWLVVRLRADT